MAEMNDEIPKIPRIAINDEPAWTPQLTAHGKREASGSGISKMTIFIIVMTTFMVIIIGVVAGNLITTAVNGKFENLENHLALRQLKSNGALSVTEKGVVKREIFYDFLQSF